MTHDAAIPVRTSRRRTLRRLLLRCLWFVVLGAAANVVVAYGLGLMVDVSQGRVDTAGSWTGSSQWTVTRWARGGAAYYLSVREPGGDWSPGQATGPPDTPTGGDQVTAWASLTPDSQAEWLVLDYAEAVVPRALRVYEIYSTGAVNRVTALDDAGNEVEAWAGVDPAPRGARIATSEIPLKPLPFATKRVKVYLDSPAVTTWNEVDAVGLVGPGERVQWAVGAQASSTYASGSRGMLLTGGASEALAPPWAGFERPTEDFVARRVNREERAVEARGWPMLSLWGRVRSAKVMAPPPAVPLGAGSTSLAMASGLVVLGGTPAPPRGPSPGEPPLLVHPIWRGFAVNSLFYAVLLLALYWALTVPLRFVREVGRMRRGCCVACGYDLGFDFVRGCPECGWRRSRNIQQPHAGS